MHCVVGIIYVTVPRTFCDNYIVITESSWLYLQPWLVSSHFHDNYDQSEDKSLL